MSYDNVNMLRKSRSWNCLLATIALLLFARNSALAQLRPLDPVDYHAFTGSEVRFEVGVGTFDHQRASLAGTAGRLWEAGNFRLQIRTGRVVLDFGGTLQRFLHEDEVWSAPFGGAKPPPANRNVHDSGDYRAATTVRLSSEKSAMLTTLRFGARLPTTDNMVGLDRDATDFFSTLGTQRHFGALALSADAGLSINGTRTVTHEQSDILTYDVSAELQHDEVSPYLTAVGQEDLHPHSFRGTEDLGEFRLGVRTSGKRWLNVAWVHGYHKFSPGNGVLFSVGANFR
jgi:hypothetical protein